MEISELNVYIGMQHVENLLRKSTPYSRFSSLRNLPRANVLPLPMKRLGQMYGLTPRRSIHRRSSLCLPTRLLHKM